MEVWCEAFGGGPWTHVFLLMYLF